VVGGCVNFGILSCFFHHFTFFFCFWVVGFLSKYSICAGFFHHLLSFFCIEVVGLGGNYNIMTCIFHHFTFVFDTKVVGHIAQAQNVSYNPQREFETILTWVTPEQKNYGESNEKK